MGISDRIEAFITELMKNEDGWLELRRNELASIFDCVPSQINYVISTRFNRDKGYVVESRRGGGGYLRIRRISSEGTVVSDLISFIGAEIDYNSAVSYVSQLVGLNIISDKEARLMISAISEQALEGESVKEDALRANIMRSMLFSII